MRNDINLHFESYWVLGLRPLSGILKPAKHSISGNWTCFRPQMRGEGTYFLGSHRRNQPQSLDLANTAFRKLDLFPSSDEGRRYLLCWLP
jgi:hypothetical protein